MKKLFSLILAIGLLMTTLSVATAYSDKVIVTDDINLYEKSNRDGAPIPITLPHLTTSPSYNYQKSVVVYQTNPEEMVATEIWKVSTSNPIPTQLTLNLVPDVDPSYSPDGTKIAWISYEDTPLCNRYENAMIPNLWVMNTDGSNAHVVACVNARGTSWNPESTQIMITNFKMGPITYNDDEEMNLYNDLYAINANRIPGSGLGITQITDDDELIMEVWPDWSSNGESVAYQANTLISGTNYLTAGIYVKTISGSEYRQIALPGANYPSWAPEDERVMFSRGGNLYSIESTCDLSYQTEVDCDIEQHLSVIGTTYADWGYGDGAPDLADLVVTDIWMQENVAGSGECNVRAYVKNIGTETAGPSNTYFWIEKWLAGDYSQFYPCEVVGQPLLIASNQQVEVICPIIFTHNYASYVADTTADNEDVISEIDENNNDRNEGDLNCPEPEEV